MHLTGIKLGGIPPFTEPITLRFDDRVNVFIGPNASGKSRILEVIKDELLGPEKNAKRPISDGREHLRATLVSDDAFEEITGPIPENWARGNFLFASEDWLGTDTKPIMNPDKPAVIYVGAIREGLPSVSQQPDDDAFGDTGEEALDGSFSGPRVMCAAKLLGEERQNDESDAPHHMKYGSLLRAVELSSACSKLICDEAIRESALQTYMPGPDVRGYFAHPFPNIDRITVLPLMGVNTTDKRNFEGLSVWERPSDSAYREETDSIPIYLGHVSSGTEGTLLWILWVVLKLVHFYDFNGGNERDPENRGSFKDSWDKKPAILLIDEIENHLHPTWQRRVIPALLEHFPGLQIFATTHSPFVVAGLKAGQVHVLKRDESGVVTAETNPQDVVGWTMDEILRGMMGVDEPTDQLTVDRAQRLRELREKEILNDAEETELNQLRRQVNSDFLTKSGPLEAQRERYADMMQDFLRLRQRELNQEGE